MGWFYLILGALLEVGWAFGLKFSEGFTNLISTVITIALIGLSFFFFSLALKSMPLGIAYAVFTGLGTVGTVFVGVIFLGESITIYKAIFILVLISGILGLKLATTEDELQTDEKNDVSYK